jgi:hypothetical protein
MKREYFYIAAAVALGGVAYLIFQRPSTPTPTGPAGGVAAAGGGGVTALLGLPDPSTVPLGTRSGQYMVTQSRLPGSRPTWTWTGFGGGVPGMFT